MPNMTLLRVGDQNLIYKIKEVMENNGFTTGKYQVIDGFPNNVDLQNNHIWPTISVEVAGMFGRDVEIGSNQWPGVDIMIDVLGRTDSQRDDVSYIIWKSMNEILFTLYDFNSGFPSTVGDYSGISTVGDWYLDSLSINTMEAPNSTTIEGLKHHALIDGFLYLPNINL